MPRIENTMNEMVPLLQFLESQLGQMAGGQIFESPPGREVYVARYDNQPVTDAITYVTTGLSRHVLHQLSGPDIRLELLTCTWSSFREASLDSLLFILAQQILDRHHAPAQGEYIGPAGPVVTGSKLEAFYFMPPLYHPETLEVFSDEPPETIIVWALPVAPSEVEFIKNSGWRAFEKELHRVAPDVMDMFRDPIV